MSQLEGVPVHLAKAGDLPEQLGEEESAVLLVRTNLSGDNQR